MPAFGLPRAARGTWLAGALLIWLLVPVPVLDILIDPSWHAPHWQCDSLGLPVFAALTAAAPFALVALLVAYAATRLATLGLPGAARRPPLLIRPASPRAALALLLIAPLVAGLVAVAGEHLWLSLVPQTITADCGGTAEPITLTRRAPLLQLTPLLALALAVWLLHLRAWASAHPPV